MKIERKGIHEFIVDNVPIPGNIIDAIKHIRRCAEGCGYFADLKATKEFVVEIPAGSTLELSNDELRKMLEYAPDPGALAWGWELGKKVD